MTTKPLGARSLLSSLSTQAACLSEPFYKNSPFSESHELTWVLKAIDKDEDHDDKLRGAKMPLCARPCSTGGISSLGLDSTERQMP